MTGSVVGSRYARALVDVVLSPGSQLRPGDAVTQLQAVEALLASSPELRAIMDTPAVPGSRKKAVLEQLAVRTGASPLISNFLKVLVDHKRIGILSQIRSAFELLLDEHLGYVRIDVASAAPLDDEQRKQLETEMMQISGKQVRMRTTVDPDLLGGIIARLGSTVYDGSIRGQLETMRRKLTSESTDYKVGI
jgi:F-type H+-transporting ATPase subunit delta